MTAEDGEAFRFCRCGDGPDWQEQALAFAAAHRKPTERWSEPLQTLSFDEIKSICFELGGNPHPRWFLFAMGQLQTLAEVQGRYDPDTDRIRLPEVAA